MLRAIGARRGQVLRSVVLESVVVGAGRRGGRAGGRRRAVVRPAGAARRRRPRHPERLARRVVGDDHDGARGRRGRERAVGRGAGGPGQPGPPHRRPARRRRRPLRRVVPAGRRRPAADRRRRRLVRRGPVGVRPGRPAADRPRGDDGRPRRVHPRPGAGRPGRPAARRADAAVRRHRQVRPGERPPQPQAHRGHGVGADDRRRPRRVHHDPGGVDQGLDRVGRRRVLPGRLRRRVRLVHPGLRHDDRGRPAGRARRRPRVAAALGAGRGRRVDHRRHGGRHGRDRRALRPRGHARFDRLGARRRRGGRRASRPTTRDWPSATRCRSGSPTARPCR